MRPAPSKTTAAGIWKDAGSINLRLYRGCGLGRRVIGLRRVRTGGACYVAVSARSPMPQPPGPGPRRSVSVTGVITAAGGLALLVWVVLRVGVAEIAADVRQVGWGLAAVVAIGGLRFLLRAAAWRLCLDPPPPLRLRGALPAGLLGGAVRDPE